MSPRFGKLSVKADAGLRSLFDAYVPAPDVYDELKTRDGELRPHWQRFVQALEQIGPADLKSRWKRVDRILYENGLTHNLYAKGPAAERPWQLDPIPLLISAGDWRKLEAGLTQRARLLEAILDDCYSEQHLIREGHLPATLILGNPRFLRPCHSVKALRMRARAFSTA